MAFRIAPFRIPNMSTDFGNVGALTANIGQQFLGGMEQGRKQAEETETRALLGEAMKTGDYTKAGQAFLSRGKVEQGMALLGFARQAASDENDNKVLRSLGLGGAPSASGVGGGAVATPRVSIPRVQAPKTGVHVAMTEDDDARLERATGMVTTDADLDAIVKTVYGEAAGEGPAGQQAVAAVIRNRANQAGLTPEQITRERNQFEPWNTAAGRARMENMPQKRFGQIADTIAPVINEGVDPTGGATHFYAPKAQAALGRPAPRWDDGSGTDLGNHRFFNHGYGQGGGAPAMSGQAIIASAQGLPDPPAMVAQAPGFLSNEPPPATAFAPQGQPAPSQVAQAPAQSQGAALPGDDPIRLRQEAAYYERSNPEAARQLRARADVAERQGGVQTAQAAADQPAPGASEAQGFVVPGTGEVVPVETIATNPRLKNLAMAMAAIKDPAKRAGVEKLFQLELEATKERAAAELRSAELEGKRLANDKARRELNGPGVRTLTSADERTQFGVDPNYKGPVQVDREGKLLFPGKASTSVEIKNEGQIPPGYRMKRDAQGQPTELEPIPGGPAAEKVGAAAEKEKLNREQTQTTGNVVLTALDDIDRLMKEATLPTTGAIGSRVADIKGTAAFDIKSALTTIGANISFDKLSQMRAASPTGGALGAVTENELKLLENSMAALQQAQSEGQFKANLGRVRANFERVVHGRTLTPQERKADGPMTAERAKSLRDEAKAAIAGGAPREEVAKRLKEKYGITPEGL
jgi:hypothetical protein